MFYCFCVKGECYYVEIRVELYKSVCVCVCSNDFEYKFSDRSVQGNEEGQDNLILKYRSNVQVYGKEWFIWKVVWVLKRIGEGNKCES